LGLDFCGGAADLFKAFDQILRELLFIILEMAGFPKRLLKPYAAMLSNLLVYNCFAGHIGAPHKHPRGIPQGCPLSMVCLALLARPWILMMKEKGLAPRLLADDVLLLSFSCPSSPDAPAPPHPFPYATSHEYLSRFVDGFNSTLAFFADAGGKVSPSKASPLPPPLISVAFLETPFGILSRPKSPTFSITVTLVLMSLAAGGFVALPSPLGYATPPKLPALLLGFPFLRLPNTKPLSQSSFPKDFMGAKRSPVPLPPLLSLELLSSPSSLPTPLGAPSMSPLLSMPPSFRMWIPALTFLPAAVAL
jgi:hypothetical protein